MKNTRIQSMLIAALWSFICNYESFAGNTSKGYEFSDFQYGSQFVQKIYNPIESGDKRSKAELKSAFLQVMFGNNPRLDLINPYSEILKKLSTQEDVSVVVFLPENLTQRNLIYDSIIDIFERISKITGINFLYDNSEKNQMMLLVIGDVAYVEASVSIFAEKMGVSEQYDSFQSSLDENSDRPLCFSLGLPHSQRKDAVGVSISGIESRFFEKCIYTQIFRMLGLNNDLQSKTPTALDGIVDSTYPNNLDWQLLQLLYDSRFEAGMGVREVELILDQILRD